MKNPFKSTKMEAPEVNQTKSEDPLPAAESSEKLNVAEGTMTKKKSTFPDLSVLSYRIFGEVAIKMLPYTKDLDETIRRGLLRTTAEKYISKMIFVSILAFLISIVATFPFMFRWLLLQYALMMSLGLGLLAGTITFMILYMLPSYVAGTRKRNIDKSLNFTTQYMAILAGAEVTPERIFKSVLQADVDQVIKDEVGEVVKGMDIFGEDFYSAINNRIKKTPSRKFGDLMKGILAVGSMGGDLRRYLHLQGKIFMRQRRIELKKQLESLAVTAEIYISMAVVLPLIMIVMFATMSFINSGGINALLWMYVLTFVMIPAISALMLLIIDTSVPKEE